MPPFLILIGCLCRVFYSENLSDLPPLFLFRLAAVYKEHQGRLFAWSSLQVNERLEELSSGFSSMKLFWDRDELQSAVEKPPLWPQELPSTRVTVLQSSIRPNNWGKALPWFAIEVAPPGREAWTVEKLYSDVLRLDHTIRATVGKSASQRIAGSPEGKLWRDRTPAKAGLRKVSSCSFLLRL